MLKKLVIPVMAALLTCGCAVSASEEMSSYSATVIDSSDEDTVIRIESDISDDDTRHSGGISRNGETVSLKDPHDLIIFDGDRIIHGSELEDNEKVIVSFSHGKTVIHTLDESD